MALQLGALRKALLEAGTTPETAERAAEEVAGHYNRTIDTGTKLGCAEGRFDRMDLRLTHMDWKINIILTVVILMLGSHFFLWSKLAEISGQISEMSGQLSQIQARLH